MNTRTKLGLALAFAASGLAACSVAEPYRAPAPVATTVTETAPLTTSTATTPPDADEIEHEAAPEQADQQAPAGNASSRGGGVSVVTLTEYPMLPLTELDAAIDRNNEPYIPTDTGGDANIFATEAPEYAPDTSGGY